MIDYRITGKERFLQFLEVFPKETADRVEVSVGIQVLRLTKHVQGKLNGSVLNSKTGKLSDAIARGSYVVKGQGKITGVVGLDGATKEVAIQGASQEFGADIGARVLEAVNVSALRFTVGGGFGFAKTVQLPAIKIPERSFLRSSLKDMRDSIGSEIMAAASKGWNFL